MSTKVYNAYRLEKGVNPFELAVEIQARATLNAHVKLQQEIRRWGDVSPTSVGYKEQFDQITRNWSGKLPEEMVDKVVRYNIATKLMKEEYRESSTKGLRSPWDYDANLTFRYLKGRVYMQVFAEGGLHGIFNKWTRRPYAVDYHYQNQTDPPKNVTKREWKQRRDVWDELYKTDVGRKSFLSLVVMDFREFETWSILDAWDFGEKLRAAAKKGETSEHESHTDSPGR